MTFGSPSADAVATAPGPAAETAFRNELNTRNVFILRWTAVIFHSVVLGWSVFDWLLAREHWSAFLVLRLVAVGVNTVLVLVAHHPKLRAYTFWFWVLWLWILGGCIIPMLLVLDEAFVPYVLGYSLVLLAAGVLPLWPPRWAFASVTAGLLSFCVALVIYGHHASTSHLTTGLFFTVTIAAGSPLVAATKYGLTRRAWFASRELQDERSISERLRAADRIKDEILANVSHELRTPLNGIIGLSEGMLRAATATASAEDRDNLAMIASSGRRLSNLVNDILDFSRLKKRDLSLRPRAVNINDAVDSVLGLLDPLARDKSIKLINLLGPFAPQVWADAERLQQILTNLVGNALKFTSKGQVSVRAEPADDFLKVTVEDTGIGIPTEHQQRIFESFEQADASISREFGGTGLGLAITRQLVELNGGTITVRSQPGLGAAFSFTVPLARGRQEVLSEEPISQVHGARHLPEAPRPITPIPVADKGSAVVLVVDDEPVNLQVALKLLRSEGGYTVRAAQSGADALTLLAEPGFHPDLVLLDVMMPKMSGYEVLRQIRSSRSALQLPVVLLTAKNQEADLIEGFEAGANDYVTKPISRGELLSRIKTHVELARVSASYARFVPHDFIRHLARNSIVDVKLGDQVQQDMTVLFSDIRSFTTLSEEMTPRENFNFLNSFLARVAPVIDQHGGFIDQYIGDALMALFPGSIADSVRAAAALRIAVRLYNSHRSMSGYRPIQLGTGIHSGPLILGTIGYERRMQTTVIADTVNQASRLEGLTKYFGSEVLLSEQVVTALGSDRDRHPVRGLGKMRVKGKRETVTIYELLAGAEDAVLELRMKTRQTFEDAVQHLGARESAAAVLAFQEVLKIDPSDTAARRLLERATQQQMGGDEGELVDRRA